jgi:hypothetical protein
MPGVRHSCVAAGRASGRMHVCKRMALVERWILRWWLVLCGCVAVLYAWSGAAAVGNLRVL